MAKTLKEQMDALHSLNQRIRAKKNEISELTTQKQTLQAAIIALMEQTGLSRAATDTHVVSVITADHYHVTDWEALYKYLKEKDAFYLLQRRVNEGALRDLSEMGESVPGVATFSQPKLSFRKDDK